MKNPIQEIMPFSGLTQEMMKHYWNEMERMRRTIARASECEIIIFVRDNSKQQETTKTQQEEAKVTTTMKQKESAHFS